MATIELGPFEYADKIPLKTRLRRGRRAGRARGVGPVRLVPRPGRRDDAELRQHRRPGRRQHDGRHLGHRRLVRPDRRQRAPLGRRRHRRRARAAAGRAGDGRRRLPHRQPLHRRRGRPGRATARCSAPAASSPARSRSSTPRPGEELGRGVVPPWCVAVSATRPRDLPRRRVRPAVRPRDQAPAPRASATTSPAQRGPPAITGAT